MAETKRPASLGGWLYLRNDDLDGAEQRVPDTLTDDDLLHFAVRGWHPVESPGGPEISTPQAAHDLSDGDRVEWIELVHPVTGGRQLVPNHPDAIAGQIEVGWVEPKRDGTVPRAALRKAARQQGVDVKELPGAHASTDTDDRDGAAAAEENDTSAGDSTATTEKE